MDGEIDSHIVAKGLVRKDLPLGSMLVLILGHSMELLPLVNDVKVSFARSIANLAAYILAKEVNVSSNPLE